ncbi:MAG: ATPase [Sphingomonadaceae bacterium]|nr:ATPase [Sphingomonadaceae bacterium]
MKRFWKDVTIIDGAIALDGRLARTPARAALTLPVSALAQAVAEEWRGAGETVDPRAMPLTGLANAAIDRAGPDLAASLARYAESELLAYRAEAPPELVAREAEAWNPLLEWARGRYDVAFAVTTGIVHLAQPPATVARLGAVVGALDAFRLAGLAPLVTIGGSLVAALGVLEGAIGAEAAFDACHLDELWQAGRWGEDALAAQARDQARADFLAGARFLALLAA